MKPIEWLGTHIKLLDQTELPLQETYLDTADYQDVINAIKQLKVRGAPAIGIAAAYGIALGGLAIQATDKESFLYKLENIFHNFAASRPTAVNLFYAINLQKQASAASKTVDEIKQQLIDTALRLHKWEEQAMTDLSKSGTTLIKDGFKVITHCNTGQLATGVSYGTALGVIKAAAEQGKNVTVYVDETRPLLQGARLTTWELHKLGIPFILITDNMAGHLLSRGEIDCIIVGADRIAANGDTANKIGTYSLSVLARENNIPFYTAAPLSTIDTSIRSGINIPIEERDPEEILQIRGLRIAPEGTTAYNLAFDVTPHKYISAIITQKGIITKPFAGNIKTIFQEGY
ncbi:MAG: S-methyl-5-thioribose-1-phosphate isomerase [Dehalococcoidia bacterium]|nr:S-methyl-5-thioribose-1-phosphate isomerase [Dehalococcoidia bacterium]